MEDQTIQPSSLNRVAKILMVAILLTLNVTKVIYLTETLRFNAAISDVFLPFAGVYLLVLSVKKGFRKTFPYLGVFIALAGWIVLTGLLAIQNPELIDSGLSGLVSELVKTLICIAYFYIGYQTLRVISVGAVQKTWIVAALVFVIGGFAIYMAAQQGVMLMGDNPNYLKYYMGTDTDPNHAATYLSITGFAMGVFLFLAKTRRLQIALGFVLLLSVIGILAIGSRGGLIGFAAGAGVLGLIYILSRKWQVVTALLLVGIALLGFMQFDHLVLEDALMSRVLYKFENIDDGLETRFNLGKAAVLMGLDHPIFGVGRGNYETNKDIYFEQMGAEIKGDIPHNTYAGLFAETGIIGWVLFFSPLWLVAYSAFKRYRKNPQIFKASRLLWAWVIAGFVAVGTQAIVLNVENRRFLWYMAGLLICFFESNSFKNVILRETLAKSEVNKKPRRWVNGLLATAFIIFFAYSVITVSVPGRRLIYTQSTTYVLPVEADAGQEMTYTYTLNLPNNEAQTERLKVSVFERLSSGEEIELDTYSYWGANGTVQRTFVPTEDDSDLYARYQVLDNTLETYYVQPLWVEKEDQVKKMKCRYLQPASLTAITQNFYWEDASAIVQSTDFSQAIGTVFGNSIEVTDVKAEMDDAGALVTLTFAVQQALTQDFYFSFYGSPDNLHLLDESRFRAGTIGFALEAGGRLETSTWVSRETYEVTYEIPFKTGTFKLGGYFYYRLDDENQVLYFEDGKTYAVNFGYLNLDELFEKAESP